jgi:multiple sugar transport system substrate-binding protein
MSARATMHRQASLTRRGFLIRGMTAAAAGSVLWAAACRQIGGRPSGPGGSQTPAEPSFAGKNVRIEYWEFLSTPEGKGRTQAIEEFNTVQNEITLEIVSIAGQGAVPAKVAAAAAAGTPPDVMFLTWDNAAAFVGSAIIADIEQHLKLFRDWTARKQDAYPGILKAHYWQGRLASVPIYGSSFAMYYNTALLAERGLTEPRAGWTWEDFVDVARRASTPPDTYAVHFLAGGGIATTVYWWNWAGSNGSALLSQDGTKASVTTPEVIAATQYLVDLAQKHGVMTLGTNLFAQGKQVFETQGAYRIPTWQEANIPFGAVPMPVKTKPHSYVAAHHAMIFESNNADKRAAAAKLLLWALSPKVNARIVRMAGTMPAYDATTREPEFTAYISSHPALKAFTQALGTSDALPLLPNAAQFYGTFGDQVARALKGEAGVREALTEAQQRLQIALDEALRMKP